MSLPFSRSNVTRRSRSVLRTLWRRLANAATGGPVVVLGIGIGHLVVALWNFRRELQMLDGGIGPFAAAGLVGVGGVFVCLLGGWLWQSDYTARDRWVVGAGTIAGGLVVGSIIYLSIVVRLLEGRSVAEPVFVLSLASGQGALSGSLVAVLYARARREAAAARRRRDQIEFVTGILRHDVLNSMTVVRSRAEMIANGETDRHEEFGESIVSRAEKVIGLSERVKDVVSVMASDDALQLNPTAIEPIVDAQVAMLRPETDDVTIETSVDDVEVIADELFAEVVGNLVENALSHGLDGDGTITISTVLDGDHVRLLVADTGPGVPDDRKSTIFERGASSSGGGFGLFFVATMVDHYGGDIHVEDRADDRSGAVFVVELDRA